MKIPIQQRKWMNQKSNLLGFFFVFITLENIRQTNYDRLLPYPLHLPRDYFLNCHLNLFLLFIFVQKIDKIITVLAKRIQQNNYEKTFVQHVLQFRIHHVIFFCLFCSSSKQCKTLIVIGYVLYSWQAVSV